MKIPGSNRFRYGKCVLEWHVEGGRWPLKNRLKALTGENYALAA